MRITINLDGELVADAQRLTGISERMELIHKGLRLLIEREAARQLARLGGSAPDLKVRRRRMSSDPMEPAVPTSLLAGLDTLEPLDEDFPEIEDRPPDGVDL